MGLLFFGAFSALKKRLKVLRNLYGSLIGPTTQEIPQQERLGMGFEDYHNLTMVLEVIVLVL